MRKTSDAQMRAVTKYDATHTIRIGLKLNKGTDADIIEWLSRLENRQGYIKKLIREDIADD